MAIFQGGVIMQLGNSNTMHGVAILGNELFEIGEITDDKNG